MTFKYALTVCLIACLSLSCAKKTTEDKEEPLTTAQQKLINICRDDYELNIITKSYANTLWIYLPTEESFIKLQATKEGPQVVNEAKEKLAIHFLDGKFQDGTFNIEYDIAFARNYGKTFGYSSATTQKYQTDQRNILTSIFRAYGDVGETTEKEEYKKKVIEEMARQESITDIQERNKKMPPDLKQTEKIPDFFIIVLADIVTGLETKMFIHFEDLKRAMHDPSFQEEYARRAIIEQPTGHTSIIGDKEGVHLDAYDMTWGEFLTKQLIYRINFKYTRSAFPPSEETLTELLRIAYNTVNAYEFTDFTAINLKDLRYETLHTTPREDLKQYAPTKKPSKGRLHTIKFF